MKTSRLVFNIILLFNFFYSYGQTQIKARVLDYDTHLAVSCASVEINDASGDIDTTVFTNQDGEITFYTNIGYNIYINRNGYLSYNGVVEDDSISTKLIFYIYKYDSDNFKIDDIAKQDVFDIVFGFDVFSPILVESENKFNYVFSFYYAYEGKFKLAKNLQMGFSYQPLKIKWMAMNSDTLITKIPHAKERYFQASTSMDIYFRYIFTTYGPRNNRGLFLDLGGGYTLPYYFSYTYFTEDYLKTSRNHIHNFNDFSVMARLGFFWGSIRGTYRFTDILKSDFIQPSKLTLSVEFNIPANSSYL